MKKSISIILFAMLFTFAKTVQSQNDIKYNKAADSTKTYQTPQQGKPGSMNQYQPEQMQIKKSTPAIDQKNNKLNQTDKMRKDSSDNDKNLLKSKSPNQEIQSIPPDTAR